VARDEAERDKPQRKQAESESSLDATASERSAGGVTSKEASTRRSRLAKDNGERATGQHPDGSEFVMDQDSAQSTDFARDVPKGFRVSIEPPKKERRELTDTRRLNELTSHLWRNGWKDLHYPKISWPIFSSLVKTNHDAFSMYGKGSLSWAEAEHELECACLGWLADHAQ
jgi:hypothetical protein